MKRLVLSSLLTLAFAFTAAAQQSGTFTVKVTSVGSQKPVKGIAVFFYDDPSQLFNPWPNRTPENYSAYAYTDTLGEVSFSYSNKQSNDTLYYGTFDCNGQFRSSGSLVSQVPSGSLAAFPMSCLPSVCDAMINVSMDSTGTKVHASNIPLLKLKYHFAVRPGQHIQRWTFNDSTTKTGNNVVFNLNPGDSGKVSYCYKRLTVCDSICGTTDQSGYVPTPITCQADYFVDTVNSGRFQGQLIVGENSSSSAGRVVDWVWDFGDGTIKTGQYPSHTYSNNGVYEVCLSILAINQTAAGPDSCISTFCDSIGFDSNGNLVFKGNQGFTINVVDPNTFSIEQLDIASQVKMFPNPAVSGTVNLEWNEQLSMKNVELLTLDGRIVEKLTADESPMKLENLASGTYLLRFNSEQGVTHKKLFVQ